MSDVLAFALATAKHIGPVFPCAPKSKEPFGKLVPNGCHGATRDPSIIRDWFRPHSTLNLALTFEPGMFALDIDPRAGGDEELGRLEQEHGKLPDTVRAITGRHDGGMHYLFRHDPAVRLKNGAIVEGIDVKGHGGYIVIAPSVHPDTGLRYEWDAGAMPSETTIAEAPVWLVDMARDRARVRGPQVAVGPVADSFFGVAFQEAGWIGGPTRNGGVCVRCPWADTHTDGRGIGEDTSTVLLPPTSGLKLGAFCCSHSHCKTRTVADLVEALPTSALRAAIEKYPDALRALRRLAANEASR